ncbi:RNA methyltransferase [Salinisphaera sp. USBA-960]|uniref:RNA methyltransferase n=1 Tax=Salinisphaera orenii TaxID=856731 RepID=UPI000DBDFF52|nr:RNA methyltransferase [Salifodinibacter halophilus]NNC25766.1 RNA methyltransferase [Salifodinibacter halophilus]
MTTCQINHNLANVRIVLVGAQHPGNIGGVARAMKVMGLTELWLVAPKKALDEEAEARASGASDVLASARYADTLTEAVAECTLVVGTSARERRTAWPLDDPRDAAERLLPKAAEAPVAVVFGCERSGLDNESLDRCQRHMRIPTNPAYSSLNLSAAVQVVVYELRMAARQTTEDGTVTTGRPPATSAEMEGLFEHLEATLHTAGFFKPNRSGALMRRVRRLFNRAAPDSSEVNLLRGGLRALTNAVRGRGDPPL